MNEFKISSPVFQHNQDIPRKYTCQGEDINPPLVISGVPENAKSLVLINDDPDAPMGTWDHWILWNINSQTTKIDEDSIPEGAVVGNNSWGRNDYGGPCPPSGKHRYFFKLYALYTKLSLDRKAKRKELWEAMKGHIIAQTELIGLYSKS